MASINVVALVLGGCGSSTGGTHANDGAAGANAGVPRLIGSSGFELVLPEDYELQATEDADEFSIVDGKGAMAGFISLDTGSVDETLLASMACHGLESTSERRDGQALVTCHDGDTVAVATHTAAGDLSVIYCVYRGKSAAPGRAVCESVRKAK